MKIRLLIFLSVLHISLFSQPTKWFSLTVITKLYDNGQIINSKEASKQYSFCGNPIPDTNTVNLLSCNISTPNSPTLTLKKSYPYKQPVEIRPNEMSITPIVHDYMQIDFKSVAGDTVYIDSINFQTGFFQLVSIENTTPYNWKGKSVKKYRLLKIKDIVTSSTVVVVDTLITFDKKTSYEIYEQSGKTILSGTAKTVDTSSLSKERIYYLRTDTDVKGIIRK